MIFGRKMKMNRIQWAAVVFLAASGLGLYADQIADRTAWLRQLAAAKDPLPVLMEGMKSADTEIQAKAVYEYFQLKKDAACPELIKMADKSSDQLARVLICCAENLQDQSKKSELLRKVAEGTYSLSASKEANRRNFNFHRVNVRLQDRKDWDFEIVKVKSVSIPTTDWKLKADRNATGHLNGFFKQDYPDSDWTKGGVKTLKYQPLVWYRIRFTAPEKPDCNAAELHFGGVESSGWIWLNGIYVGARDEGPTAWNKPFSLDITNEIRWGKENLLVVRVSSTDAEDSGIYKPITLEILK